jgi:Raf kinase inhibitor-like YbhB/YbcL family protein
VAATDVINVSSAAFAEGQSIPTRFTCDGDGQPPPLTWQGVPSGTARLALVVDDPDAPRGTFVHWVVVDMPVDATGVVAGELPRGAMQAKNSAGRASYSPPCPPSGTHRYQFTLYALSQPTGLHDGAELDTAMRSIESAATAQGRLVGTYARSG